MYPRFEMSHQFRGLDIDLSARCIVGNLVFAKFARRQNIWLLDARDRNPTRLRSVAYAKLSVNSIPVFGVAESNSNRIVFSEWSGQAG